MSSRRSIPVLLDVDTGIDDAMALALALHLPEIELVGVTTVAGNVPVALATENTRRVLAWLGASNLRVYRGLAAPLVRPLTTAEEFHGENGLGGLTLPPASDPVGELTAPEFIVQQARTRRGELTLVCVGPLSNLAVALHLEPDLPALVRQVVIMGGAFTVPGNQTPAAEFNIYGDPEAAAVVARSHLPITFIGLDVTHQVPLTRTEWARLAEATDPVAQLIYGMNRHHFERRGVDRMHLHDPLALMVAVDPTLIEATRSGVVIDTGVGERAGETLMTERPGLPRHQIALEVDVASFLRRFWSMTHRESE